MKYVGYITSDPINSGFVPHNIQNVTIKNYLSKHGHEFMLSWTEYKNHSQLAFNSLSDEHYFQGICFFSWEQLAHLENARARLKALLDRGIVFSFAREGFSVNSTEELESFFENYFLSLCIFQSGDLRQWFNERNKYL